MRPTIASGLAALIATTTLLPSSASAFSYGKSWPPVWRGGNNSPPAEAFQRIATLPNYLNNADASQATVSEIVASVQSGKTLVYTDGVYAELGFVDLSNPAAPQPLGKMPLRGEPTSVASLRGDLILVAVNTSASFTEPEGYVALIDVETRLVLAELPMAGQPDSVAVSPDRRYAAVVIENERNEEIEVQGVEGGLPQLPAGSLVVLEVTGPASDWTLRYVDLTDLADYAPLDPEPEFVDINRRNQAVVSLQENNHIAVVDLKSATVIEHFSAGTQTLVDIDKTEDGVISLTETLSDVPREPDAVAWVKVGGRAHIATANEGDLFGGSRGFSLFSPKGDLVFDSGSLLEEIAVRYGHYPENRSGNKGTEPEAIEYARFGQRDLLFVGSERGSFVAVFEVKAGREPEFVQILPAPLGPEGLLAIPSRGLLVVSGEEDDPTFGVRSALMVYRLERGQQSYPHVLSGDDEFGKPIAWAALSGMVALPGSKHELLAVSDSAFSQGRVMSIDASRSPAVITHSLPIVGGTGDFDAEGIAVAPDGSYWVASEGDESGARLNRLLQLTPAGVVLREVHLPDAIEQCRAATQAKSSLGSGFEGVAVKPLSRGYELVVAQQRGWNYTTPECETLDDDPHDVDTNEPAWTRLWVYNPASSEWRHIPYELEPLPDNASWVGLSEVTAMKRGLMVLERDNRSGDFAVLKTLVELSYGALFDGVVGREDKRKYDLLPALKVTRGWVTDKPEGVAITANNRVFVVTDNDGVDGWSGETWFLPLGNVNSLFR